MEEVRVKLVLFAGEENDRIAVFDEVGGSRRCTIRLREQFFQTLADIFFNPGEPYLGPEFAVRMLQRAGVAVDSIALSVVDRETGTVRYAVSLRQGGMSWTTDAFSLDAFGFSIVSGVPVSMTEADFVFLMEYSCMVDEHPEPEELRTAEHLARDLPKDKLGQA